MTRLKKMKTKSGKEFAAALKLEGGKIALVFARAEPVGKCPVCGKGSIQEGQKSFFCSEYKQGCRFSVWKELCGAAVTASHVKLLIQGKEAKPRKMKSKAGKEFTAGLKLEDGKVAFVFGKKSEKDSDGRKPAGSRNSDG